MALMLKLKLTTKTGQRHDGSADVYYVSQRLGEYVLQTHVLAPQRFASLTALAHTLGGIVPWDRWSEDAQLQLDQLKLRGAF
jgi:hypothetical protein